jgi:phosphoserine phosphatase RsbX
VTIGAVSFGIARRSANAAEVCGDMAGWWSRGGIEWVAIADGLGHGKDAAVAAAAALEVVAAWPGRDLPELFQHMNVALKETRGAAVGVAAVEWATGQITYAAVGNTRAALFGAPATYLDGYAGIVGGGYRRLTPVTLPFQSGDVLALWTDGLDERLDLITADHSAAGMDGMAERLLDRFAKGHDDRCVVVARLVQG